jgi:P pilus assembly chaperone PapD
MVKNMSSTRTQILISILAIGLLYMNSQAQAALIVNRSIITFDNPAVNREDVVVINSSNTENLFVEITPYTVVNPGSDEQELNPLLIDDNPEFLVTPNRLVTAPGGRSIVRFLNLQEAGNQERVYRVNMIPITPPLELEEAEENAVNSQLEVVVAYQILVIVPPANPNAEVNISREGKLVSFSNSGNSNYLLTDGEQCDPTDPEFCVALEDRRIYPGNTWTNELPFDGPFTYKVRTQSGLTTEYFR